MAEARNDLKLFYNETDITGKVDILECCIRDVSGAESDGLDLLVDHAEDWLRWGVNKNDRIRVTRSGYDSKNLFVSSIAPAGGAFRIFATGSKCSPFEPAWKSYEGMTLSQIMTACGGEGGMGTAFFGIGREIYYEYLLRAGLRAPAFLEGLLHREGAVLKCLDGAFTAIGIAYAQGLACSQSIRISPGMKEATYIRREDRMWNSLTIDTPFGKGRATDGRGIGKAMTITDIPVSSDAEAGRWARGILMTHNRRNEEIRVQMDFHPGMSAMVRIDVESLTDAKGHWIIDRAEHDLLNGTTRATLFRCLTGIR